MQRFEVTLMPSKHDQQLRNIYESLVYLRVKAWRRRGRFTFRKGRVVPPVHSCAQLLSDPLKLSGMFEIPSIYKIEPWAAAILILLRASTYIIQQNL